MTALHSPHLFSPMATVFKLEEFFSRTELEKIVNNPPSDPAEIDAIVERFQKMQGCVTPSGEDLLEALLLQRHMAFILLGHLRLAADPAARMTTRRMIQKKGLFAPLAYGFQYSTCNFAKAIFRREE
jgi:hypothetical protein